MVGLELVKDRATRDPDTATCEALIQACADRGCSSSTAEPTTT